MNTIPEWLLRMYIYKYALELIAACALFGIMLPRRRFWVLSAVGTSVVMLLLSSWWTRELSSILWLSIVRYIVISAAAILGFALTFRIPMLMVLYCSMGAVCSQHVAVQLYNLLMLMFRTESSPFSLNVAVYLLVMVLVYSCAFVVLPIRARSLEYHYIKNRVILFVSTGISLLVLVLSVLLPKSGAYMDPMSQAIYYLYDLIACLFAFTLLRFALHNDALENEVSMLRQIMEKDRKNFASRMENVELVGIKCHDIKKQLALLRGRLEESEIRELENVVEIYDTSYKTGSSVLDTILTEKSLVCGNHSITLTCMVQGDILAFMSPMDIFSVFANAIDNAISAVARLPEAEKRVIDLTVREDKGFAVIHIGNYYDGKIEIKDGLPVTTNEDRDYHGFGFKSIAYTVEKYKGSYSISTDRNLFRLNILLPLQR